MNARAAGLLLPALLAACSRPAGRDVEIGQKAPPIRLKAWVRVEPTSGQDASVPWLDLDGLKGRVVLIENWATWCSPCIQKIPDLIDLQKKHPRGLAIVSLSREGPKVVRRFIDETTLDELQEGRPKTPLKDVLNYNLASIDLKEPSFRAYFGRLQGVPSFYVIGRDGRVENAAVGSYEIVLEEIARLLARRGRTAEEERAARCRVETEREYGSSTKSLTCQLKEDEIVDPEKEAAAIRRQLAALDELVRVRPSRSDQRDYDALELLPKLYRRTTGEEKAAVLKRLRRSRAELFERLSSTRSPTLSWANLVYNATQQDAPELLDPEMALKASGEALESARTLEAAYPVKDFAHDARACALFANGDIEGAAKAERLAVEKATPVRRRHFKTNLGLFEDLLKEPRLPLEEIAAYRRSSGFSAEAIRAALKASEKR